MAVAGTDIALTVDSNVVHYYFLFINNNPLPLGLMVRRIKDFSNSIMSKYPIAINKFIRIEYEQCEGLETIKNWLAKRLQMGLAIEVDCKQLPKKIKNCLRGDYGFDCQSWDMRYLQACFNTIFKHLVTANSEHFDRPHRSVRGRTMPVYLKRELDLCICTIDKCCMILLDGQKDEQVDTSANKDFTDHCVHANA